MDQTLSGLETPAEFAPAEMMDKSLTLEQAQAVCDRGWPVRVGQGENGVYLARMLQVTPTRMSWTARLRITGVVEVAAYLPGRQSQPTGLRPGEIITAPRPEIQAAGRQPALSYAQAIQSKIDALCAKRDDPLTPPGPRAGLSTAIAWYERQADDEVYDPPPPPDAPPERMETWRSRPKGRYRVAGEDILILHARKPHPDHLALLKRYGFSYRGNGWSARLTPERLEVGRYLAGESPMPPTASLSVPRQNYYRLDVVGGKPEIHLHTPHRLENEVTRELYRAGFRWYGEFYHAEFTPEREALAQKIASGYGLHPSGDVRQPGVSNRRYWAETCS